MSILILIQYTIENFCREIKRIETPHLFYWKNITKRNTFKANPVTLKKPILYAK